MKRLLYFLLILPMFLFANLTKDDLKEIRSIVKEEVKAEVGALEKKMDAKFEAVDKRFEDMLHYMDKRFEAVDKRFEAVDKRFEAVDKRFEAVDKRFDDQMNFLYLITSIFTAFTVGVIGFALWDRRSIIDKAKKESVEEVKKEIANDFSRLDKIAQVMQELAKTDERVAKILEKHHLKLI